MALPIFFYRLFADIRDQLLLGIHLFKPTVFFLQLFESLDHGGIHTTVFGPPFLELRTADAVFSADIAHGSTVFILLEHGHYLTVCES